MSQATLQVQRFTQLALAVGGLLLLAWLLRTGWLQTLATRTSLGMFLDLVERLYTPSAAAYLALFHYLLAFTMAMCFLQVALSLLQAVRTPVLLAINWGVLLCAAGAMLFFWVFGTRPLTQTLMSWLTVQSSVLCFAVGMHAFARAFLVYPAILTEDRANFYRRRFLRRASAEIIASKSTTLGRWRRAMLAWQLRLGRALPRSRALRREVHKELHRELAPNFTRLMLLYLCPGLTFTGLCGAWSVRIGFGEEASWGALLMVPALLCVVYAWGITVTKMMMDYRLGDPVVRKQVLWLLIGMSLPLYVAGTFGFTFAVAVVAPQVVDYTMLFMMMYFPPLAFLLFVICLMVSIFFYGAIDPARVLRASALYSFLGLLLTVLFAAVEQLLSPLLTNAIGLDGTQGGIVSAAIVALSFRPLHRYIEATISRQFQNLLGGPPVETSTPSKTSKTEASASSG
jgi:hypothetical protein